MRNSGILLFRRFAMYCWHVCLLRSLWNCCASTDVEFEISTFLGHLYMEGFSIVHINSMCNAWRLRCLRDLHVFWKSPLSIGEVADKYEKRSIWSDVHDLSGCKSALKTGSQGSGLNHFKFACVVSAHNEASCSRFENNSSGHAYDFCFLYVLLNSPRSFVSVLSIVDVVTWFRVGQDCYR